MLFLPLRQGKVPQAEEAAVMSRCWHGMVTGSLYAPHPCDASLRAASLQTSVILPMFPRYTGEVKACRMCFAQTLSLAESLLLACRCRRHVEVQAFFRPFRSCRGKYDRTRRCSRESYPRPGIFRAGYNRCNPGRHDRDDCCRLDGSALRIARVGSLLSR